MAEEAFALSPISARPSVPGEADYDAIREAFMETARGRWFLSEYAKRNRHTDTGMVLEAVARIEANLAAQKASPVVSLLESLGAIRTVVRHAKATAIEAMPRVESDETLTAARNGARIIREIAWTLRECGADTRICDLLDTQVKAIDAGQQTADSNGREEVLASYDLLMQRIEQLVDGSAPVAASAKAEAAPVAEQPVTESREASVTPLFKAPVAEPVAEAPVVAAPAAVSAIALDEPVETVAEAPVVEAPAAIVESTAEIAATMADATIISALYEVAAVAEPEAETTSLEVASPEATDDEAAQDLAVLDMVAMEMAVQDPVEPEIAEPEAMLPDVIEPPITFEQIAEVALAPEMPEPIVQPAPQPEPSYHPSLGAALIANGVIANPNATASDPLAPIRRMSQAEKIAFFS